MICNNLPMTIMPREAAEFWWKIEVPPEIAHYEREFLHNAWPGVKQPPWIPVTFKALADKRLSEKKEDSLNNLNNKLRGEKLVAGFVWVFEVPGFFFGGSWLYIKTLSHDYGISFGRGEYNKELIVKSMELFPCGIIPIYENFEVWMKAFAKQYKHVGFKRKKNQGIAKCWCKIDESDCLINIETDKKQL